MNASEQFESIVNEHYAGLFRFAMSITRSESDAADLTQETFRVWATKGHQLRDSSRVKAWLYTTLHRAFLKGKRTERRYEELDGLADELPGLAPNPANQVDASHVLVALSQVDPIYQPAIALFYLQDCSYQEIAHVLRVPVGTVRSRLSRGLAQLKRILLSEKPPRQVPIAIGPKVPLALGNHLILQNSPKQDSPSAHTRGSNRVRRVIDVTWNTERERECHWDVPLRMGSVPNIAE
jgi:RNA polymerase sigma-70 factor (ECF subfamily)